MPQPPPSPDPAPRTHAGRDEEVRRLFEECLGLLPADRTAHARAGASDELVLEEVLAMLEIDAAGQADGLLDPPDAAERDGLPGAVVPTRLGPWEIRRRLGRGGMADVWLAARVDGLYRRQVAIKRLHPGLATEETIARFERERQILAKLTHPGVARMLEAAEDESGDPYIVMECVDGTPVDAYCDERRLGVEERIELLIRIADALAEAHRMHIVHRDIKPSNILVDREGRPVLLDFGVAKVLDPTGDVDVAVTRDVNRYLTPNYASPEQLSMSTGGLGAELQPTSDVYSLGVLAFELLTGAPPLKISGRSAADAAEVLRFEDPPRLVEAFSKGPDREAVAKARGQSPKALAAQLGDPRLEAVVAAALRKEPARRHPDASALRDELRRVAAGEPVLSRRDPWWHGAWRAAKRHRLAVGLAAALVVVLAVGVVAVGMEASRANRSARLLAQEARKNEEQLAQLQLTLTALMRDTFRNFAGIPGTENGIRAMVRTGVKIAAKHPDPEFQAVLGMTLIDLEDMEVRRRGHTERGLEAVLRGLELCELAERPREDGGPARLLANSSPAFRHAAAYHLAMGNVEEAKALLARAAERCARFAADNPARRATTLAMRLNIDQDRARIARRTGQFEDALEIIDGALLDLAQVRDAVPDVRVEAEESDGLSIDMRMHLAVMRSALMDLEYGLTGLRRRVSLEAQDEDTVAAKTDWRTEMVQAHNSGELRLYQSVQINFDRWELLLERGRAEEAALDFAETYHSGHVDPDNAEYTDLFTALSEVEFGLDIIHEVRARGGDASGLDEEALIERHRALGRAAARRFGGSLGMRKDVLRAESFLAHHRVRSGASTAELAAELGAAQARLEDLARAAPWDFDIAELRVHNLVNLFDVQSRAAGGGWTEAQRAELERALGAVPGDARAQERLAEIRERISVER